MSVEETAILVVGSGLSFIAGAIILSNINLKNYFKKMNFKANLSNTQAVNKIKLEKMRRELNISMPKTASDTQNTGGLDRFKGLIPLFNSLDPEQKDMLFDFIAGRSDTIPEGSGAIETILGVAKENPDLVKEFVKGLTSGVQTGSDQSNIVFED